MKHKRSLALVLIVTIGLVLLLQRSERSRLADDQRSHPVTLEQPQSTVVANTASTPDQAQHDPSAQLQMEVGTPTPIRPYPRGENQRRRYGEPNTHLVDPTLLKRSPAMLAMLPADGCTTLTPEETPKYTLVAKRLVLDTAAIDRIVNGETARLIVPTTGTDTFDLRIASVKSRSAQTHTLIGKIAGEPETSQVLLVYHDGILRGSVNSYGENRHIEYEMLPDGHLLVREIDERSMTATCGNPNDCGHDHHADDLPCPETAADQLQEELSGEGIELEIVPQPEPTVIQDTTGWNTVDLVVGYDQQARISAGSQSAIEATILLSVDRMNLAFSNSQITATEVMLLGTIEDPDYVYPGAVAGSMSTGDELGNLDNTSDGILDTVSDYASQLGADFKSFVLNDADGSAGIAFRPGSSSVVAMTYMTSTRITFAHELGHNLGCDHSWGDSSQAYHPHYGWRMDIDGNATTSGRYRTIMAYDWAWSPGGNDGGRVPYYANPAVLFNGVRTGATLGYDATGDTTCDPRYVTGGFSFTTGSGFDGTNNGLAAQNALTILNGQGNSFYGAGPASNYETRAPFDMLAPVVGTQLGTGETLNISFIGGDHTYTALIELWKGVPGGTASLVTTIASAANPATDRNFSWTIPTGTAGGNDYFVKVTLQHSFYSDVSLDSVTFTITSGNPRYLSQSPSSTPAGTSLSQIAVTFNKGMDTGSFAVADDILSFTGPSGNDLSGDITSTNWSNADKILMVNFNTQTAPGYYRLHFGSQILDTEGKAIDQDFDSITGEPYEDSYVALAGLISGGSNGATIWQDMVGADAPDAGWVFSGSGHSWQTGSPTEAFPSGPTASYDGGSIIATNLAGNCNSGETSQATSPIINCSGFSNVSLTFFSWSGVEAKDEIYLEAKSSNGTWQRLLTISTNKGDYNDLGWSGYAQQLQSIADNNPNFQLRWGLVDWNKGQAPPSTGWQIDAITIKGDTASDPLPAPSVIGHSPSGNGPGPYSSIWVDFTNPMDSDGFSLGDITSFTGPSGAIAPSNYAWLSSTVLRINFPQQSANGAYSMTLATTIPDTLGNPLTSSYTADFSIGTTATPYETWAGGSFSHPFTSQTIDANPDSDPFNNLLEFAFGTDPTVTNSNPIAYIPDGEVTAPGAPVVINLGTPESADYHAVFGRRKDYLSAGLTYAVSFSATLTNWVPTATPPVPLSASSGQIEAVGIPFPSTINEGSGNVVPQFFKVNVTAD